MSISSDVLDRLRSSVAELGRVAAAFNSEAHFYVWQENRLTIRADEVCASVERLRWELDRMPASEQVSAPLDPDTATLTRAEGA